MKLTLESDFEAKLETAVLDDVEQKLRDEIGPALKDTAQENWVAYAQANGYDIDHIWEDAEGPFIQRNDSSVQLRIEWPGLSALFEFGVSPHVIRGNPILAFHWDAPPEGTRPPGAPADIVADKVNWGSVTGGIDESRAIRDGLQWLATQLSD